MVERVDSGGPITGSRSVASYTEPVGFDFGIITWIDLVGAAILLGGGVGLLGVSATRVSGVAST